MKFVHAILFLSVLCAVAGLAATTPAKATSSKTTAKKSTTKVSSTAKANGAKVTSKAAVGTTTKAPSTSHVVATAKSRKPAAGPPAPRRQVSPDRYREIQQALVNKGYLNGEPTGVWDADSVAAMQHFQSDQKQTPNGKITAASLIGLGLGAKSAGAPEAPPLGGHPAASDQSAPPVPPQSTSAPAASQ